MSPPIFPTSSTRSTTHADYTQRSATSAPRNSRTTTLGKRSKLPPNPVQPLGRSPERLGLLHQLLPHAKTIATLINLDFQPSERFHADVESAARVLGLSIQRLEAINEREIGEAFNRLAQARPDALLVGPGPFLDSRRDLLVALAAKLAMPAAYETRANAVAGGLNSYGARVVDGYWQGGIYTGRVLKGEKPAELPVLQPTKFEFVINLKTARMLGLDISPTLLVLADEVIE